MTGKLVLGIDAGGGSTRAVLVREGELISRHSSGPINLLLHTDASDRLVALINETKAELVGVGLPGLRNALQLLKFTHEVKERTGATVIAADDATIAQLGAFAGGAGIVVISGTGSVGVGWPGKGRVSRVGGHGFLLGDEGSGYWIGREAIVAALRGRDGTGPSNGLPEIVERACGTRLEELVVRVHTNPTDRTLVSKVTRALATSADPTARAILDAACDHLIAMATALRKTLGDLPVAMVGGVFEIPALAQRFTAATGAKRPVEAPEFGAVRLAIGDRNARDAALVT
ncbi:MAG: BadF/BadG/BcrA/BcrD ATPase family protein [Actinomycetota bacterium]